MSGRATRRACWIFISLVIAGLVLYFAAKRSMSAPGGRLRLFKKPKAISRSREFRSGERALSAAGEAAGPITIHFAPVSGAAAACGRLQEIGTLPA
jgi:hypothetical protein